LKKKVALIFGITGQDGSYLSRFLLEKKYIVHGVIRRSSSFNTSRIDDIYQPPYQKKRTLILHYGDLSDTLSIQSIISSVLPDEIYNLAAQSHVAVSYETPEYTGNVDGLGGLRILETIKNLRNKKKIKFYQAGTSEMFGGSSKKTQNENTPFDPKSPYAAAKVYAHHITKIYRDAYKIFASNGILFNHESPFRGETFVTKKIIKGMTNIKFMKQKTLYLGNLYSKRDWGFAGDYVEAMWKILNYKKPDDFVISTNSHLTIKQFINLVAKKLNYPLKWSGKGYNEVAYNKKGIVVIKISKRYFRPLEVVNLKGDYSKAKKYLNWQPQKKLTHLIDDMISYELKANDK
jgi:GDPmannose 4,6-dehydratase